MSEKRVFEGTVGPSGDGIILDDGRDITYDRIWFEGLDYQRVRVTVELTDDARRCVPIDKSKGEWRCRCPSDPKFDTSASPSYVSACAKCGASRPPRTR